MMAYPQTLTETETITRAIGGISLARYGDGEFKLCTGGNCVSQPYSKAIGAELRRVLTKPGANCLPCIPRLGETLPRSKVGGWEPYKSSRYAALFGNREYGSSFVSRPDSAPHIDTPAYWESLKSLWAAKNVVLATGRYNEIRENQLTGAASIEEIVCPRRDAYASINDIEAQIVQKADKNSVAIMCLGPTATVLAARLAARGIHALDLGHLGMFMRHAGQYRVQLDQLISTGYQGELQDMHARVKDWGSDGHKQARTVKELITRFGARTILDYGCGKETLRDALAPEGMRIQGYDPGIAGKAGMPKPVDLVVCMDVLEHVEPKHLTAVLAHIERVAEVAAYFCISTRSANATLPGGRNAHLIVKEGNWWLEKIGECGFDRIETISHSDREIRILASKK